MMDGCVEVRDVVKLWCKRNILDPNRLLLILVDCCYSGHWAEECAALGLPNVIVQSSTSSKRRAIDKFDATFTKHWVKKQRDTSHVVPMQGFRKPQAYVPKGVPMPAIGGVPLNLIAIPEILTAVPSPPASMAAFYVDQHSTMEGFMTQGEHVLSCHSGLKLGASISQQPGMYVCFVSVSLKLRNMDGEIVGIIPPGRCFNLQRVICGCDISAVTSLGPKRLWAVTPNQEIVALTDIDGETLNALPLDTVLQPCHFFVFRASGVIRCDSTGHEIDSLPIGRAIECIEIRQGRCLPSLQHLGPLRWWGGNSSKIYHALTDEDGHHFHAMPVWWVLVPGPHVFCGISDAIVRDAHGCKLAQLSQGQTFDVVKSVCANSVPALGRFGQSSWWGCDGENRFYPLVHHDGKTPLAIPATSWPPSYLTRTRRGQNPDSQQVPGLFVCDWWMQRFVQRVCPFGVQTLVQRGRRSFLRYIFVLVVFLQIGRKVAKSIAPCSFHSQLN